MHELGYLSMSLKNIEKNYALATQRLAILLLFIFPIGQISTDIYSPSLPAITHYFSSNSASAKLTISIYIFSLALGQLLFGPISDQMGRKKPLIAATLLYVIGSLAALCAPNLAILYLARGLQGLGAAGCVVIDKAILSESFSGNALKKISSWYGLLFSSSAILAPLLGGVLQHLFDWQANFIFLLIYSSLILFFVVIFYTETNRHKERFIPTQFLHNTIQIIRNPAFLCFLIWQAFVAGFFIVFALQGTFIIQKGLGMSALAFGNLALIIGIAVFIGSLINRKLTVTSHLKKHVLISAILFSAISLSFTTLAFYFPTNLYLLMTACFLWASICGFAGPSVFAHFISHFRKNGGLANALSGTASFTLIAIITSFMSLFHQTTLMPIALYTLASAAILWTCYFLIIEH